ncbi:MAG TPA: hypothetical protein VGR06_09860, partial [Actinophytocola sp.]|uniref:hypothetical protein n=1 Tax=Actinophytocola sp. TaxID=1872138 RepID=UPI002E04B38D|nr:hypothetical protein [Actinophytocola sp.]
GFVRLVGRVPRFGRAVLLSAAVAGLGVAAWSGSAAAEDGGKFIALRTESGAASAPVQQPIKICGLNSEFGYQCTDWFTFGSYVFSRFGPDLRWQGRITICRGEEALFVDVPSQDQLAGDVFKVDITGFYSWQEEPSPECL